MGPEPTKKFMNRIQRVVNYWILNNSFSLGISDAIPDLDTKGEIDKILNDVRTKVSKLTKRKDLPAHKLEQLINTELNGARDSAGHKAQKRLTHKNNFKQTVSAGSKGNNLNISQIMATVGQQNVEGKRISYGFRGRTLPHYEKNDIGQESRGFVENSYLRGLTPQEFFFHAMAGREGLIDTACKTAFSYGLKCV
jgi:DNA-directed RNA polymerase II subunit RPB1